MRWGAAAVVMLSLAGSAGCSALDDSGQVQRSEAGPGLERVVVRRDGDKLKADFRAPHRIDADATTLVLQAVRRNELEDARTYVSVVLRDTDVSVCRGADTACTDSPSSQTTVWNGKKMRLVIPWPDGVPASATWVGTATRR